MVATGTMTGKVDQQTVPSTAGPLLEAKELRKSYPGPQSAISVLEGVNLAVARGEMIAIMGPSGAGKSTLLHLLAALDRPTSGTVYLTRRH